MQKTSFSGLTSPEGSLGHHGNDLYIYLVYTCNVFYEGKRIEGMLRPVFYLPVPTGGSPSRDRSPPSARRARWRKKTSHPGLTTDDIALGHNGNYICMCLAYTCNVTVFKKKIEGTLRPVFHLPAPAGRSRSHDLYPCSLGGKTSHLDVTSRAMALGHRGNNLDIYLVDASNVLY